MQHQIQCNTNLEWCGEECQHQYLDRQHDTPPQPELEKDSILMAIASSSILIASAGILITGIAGLLVFWKHPDNFIAVICVKIGQSGKMDALNGKIDADFNIFSSKIFDITQLWPPSTIAPSLTHQWRNAWTFYMQSIAFWRTYLGELVGRTLTPSLESFRFSLWRCPWTLTERLWPTVLDMSSESYDPEVSAGADNLHLSRYQRFFSFR